MGFCSVVEVVMRRGEEPPLHVHANEDELYYVLEGDLTFYVGHDVFDVSPRDTVVLPATCRTPSRSPSGRASHGSCSSSGLRTTCAAIST